MGTEYKCSQCANVHTPLCEKCTTVSVPSGKERKPSLFIKLDEPLLYCDMNGEKARATYEELCKKRMAPFAEIQSLIAECARNGIAIPLSAVMAYNNCRDKTREYQ